MWSLEFTHASYTPHLIGAMAILFFIYLLLVWRRNKKLQLRSEKNVGRIFSALRLICFSLSVTLVGLGIGLLLLKPYLKIYEPYSEYEPLDIVFADDKSTSILAQATSNPCGPTRLDVARHEIEKFISLLKEKNSDRVGLVIFTRFGYRVVPVLTKDYRLFSKIFNATDEREVQSGGLLSGTNQWDAVLEATKVFKKDSLNKRILIVITDGEPDAPEEILDKSRAEALKALSELGKISTYVIGIGDPEVRYPIPKKKDQDGCPLEFYVQMEGPENGQIIFTKPDILELEGLARELGGIYRHSRTGSDLAELLNDAVNKERVLVGIKFKNVYHDLTTYLIWSVLLFLAITVLLKSP